MGAPNELVGLVDGFQNGIVLTSTGEKSKCYRPQMQQNLRYF